MVGVFTARHAAHIGARESWAARLVRNVRQKLHVVAEVVDLELFELFLPDGLDGKRYVLQAFVTLLGGDHDLIETHLVRLLRLGDASTRKHGSCEWKGAFDGSGKSEIVRRHSTPRVVGGQT